MEVDTTWLEQEDTTLTDRAVAAGLILWANDYPISEIATVLFNAGHTMTDPLDYAREQLARG